MTPSGESSSPRQDIIGHRCEICFRNTDTVLADLAQPNQFGGIGGVKRLWVCSECAAKMAALSDLDRSDTP